MTQASEAAVRRVLIATACVGILFLGCLIGTPSLLLASYDFPRAIVVFTRAPAAVGALVVIYEIYQTRRMVGTDWRSKSEVAGAIICSVLIAFGLLAWSVLLFWDNFA